LAIEISECNRMGTKVLPPDINEGFVEFAVVPEKKEIRFGMSAVKGVGAGAVEEVLRAREDGKFNSIEDFAKRVSTSKFNKRAWESLIKSGGFDGLGDRSDLLFNLDTIQAFASKIQKEALSGQTDLFGGMSGAANLQPLMALQPSPTKYTDRERLAWERELMGLYISAHPLDNYDKYFEEQTMPLSLLTPEVDGKKATIGGLISRVRTIVTKSGSKMAFVVIEDKTGESEVIVFPSLFEQFGAKLIQDSVVKITGKISAKDRDGNISSDVKMIADDIQFLSEKELGEYASTGKKMNRPKISNKVVATRVKIKSKVPSVEIKTLPDEKLEQLFVHIKDPDDHKSLLSLKQICGDAVGPSDVILVLGSEKKSAVKLPFRVEIGKNLIDSLVKTLGKESVVVK
jgi:DNA polymerase-3 subunit alpha